MGEWRTGRKVGRTLYNEDGELVGLLDTPELAERVAGALRMVNETTALRATVARLEAERDEAMAYKSYCTGAMEGQLTLMDDLDKASALIARLRRAYAATTYYLTMQGVEHHDGCPEDDTCRCPHVVEINASHAACRDAGDLAKPASEKTS